MNTSREITCEEALQFVFEFIDHELDQGRHHEMEHHLARCRSCFSRVGFERRLKARLREAGRQRAPDSLRDRVDKLLHEF